MASTTFTDFQTTIVAAWLNDVNTAVYGTTWTPHFGATTTGNLTVTGTIGTSGLVTFGAGITATATGAVNFGTNTLAVGNTTVTGTLSATGQITSTSGNNTVFLKNTSATTGYTQMQISNTSGSLILGVETSAGGSAVVGDTAYDATITGGSGIAFSANNGAGMQMRLSSTALAVTGALIIGSGGTGTVIGTYTGGGYGAIYSTAVTPSGSNYAMSWNATTTDINGTTSSALAVNNSNIALATSSGLAVTGTLTAGSFGCNGKTAQPAYASGGVLANVVAALIANGILSS
jgi:hypothetical protein